MPKMRFVVPERGAEEECNGQVPAMIIYRHRADLVEMDPREFLRRADRTFSPANARESDFRFKTVRHIIAAIRRGECFAPLELWPHKNRSYGLKHEGRHRAWVAARLGIRRVPVFLWYD